MTHFQMIANGPQVSDSSTRRERLPAALVPVQASLSFRQGLESLNHGNAREAVSFFEEALAAAPEFADGHVGLGIAYALVSRVYAALDHLERATQLEPESYYAHFKLGQLYFKLRIPQKGYEEMSRALACATSLQERKLVAQLLREERQHEKNSVGRPVWNKPFSWAGLYLGASVVAVLLLLVVSLLR